MLDTQTPDGGPKELMAWTAPSRPVRERTVQWYIGGGAVVLIGIVYGILSDSWPFSVVMLLSGAMYYLLRGHQPPLRTIVLMEQGCSLDGRFMNWSDMRGYWLLFTPEYTELHLVPAGRREEIVLQTGDVNIADLRSALSSVLPELSDRKESMLDMIIRTCKL